SSSSTGGASGPKARGPGSARSSRCACRPSRDGARGTLLALRGCLRRAGGLAMDERQSPAAGRQRPRGASATPATLALALMALAQAGLPPHAAAQEGEEPASTEV